MPAYLSFETTILKFKTKGDKTNWTYILVGHDIAEKLKPGFRRSFRIKGTLDHLKIEKTALIPAGEGNFILAVNAGMRKQLKKDVGSKIKVRIMPDEEPPPINAELVECLKDEPAAWKNFEALARSHQLYFSNWVNSAKTITTRTERIAHSVTAMLKNWNFGELIRSLKKDK